MLTVKEVAARIGAQPGNIRKWARAGRFKGARHEETDVGSYWLIPESSLDEFELLPRGRPPKARTEKRVNKSTGRS